MSCREAVGRASFSRPARGALHWRGQPQREIQRRHHQVRGAITPICTHLPRGLAAVMATALCRHPAETAHDRAEDLLPGRLGHGTSHEHPWSRCVTNRGFRPDAMTPMQRTRPRDDQLTEQKYPVSRPSAPAPVTIQCAGRRCDGARSLPFESDRGTEACADAAMSDKAHRQRTTSHGHRASDHWLTGACGPVFATIC